MGESGSVAFMFDRLGKITYPLTAASEDAMMEAAIEAGAQDVEVEASQDEDAPALHAVYTAFEDLNAVAEALAATLGDPRSTAIVWRPRTETPVAGDDAGTLMKLVDALDDDDDVQNVFLNADISDEDLARLG